LTNAIHLFSCSTHPNTAFDYKGDFSQNQKSKLISFLIFKNSDAL
jgi:hypothetical protein